MRAQPNTGGAAPPSTEIFLSLPSATKPIHWPSGEKKGSVGEGWSLDQLHHQEVGAHVMQRADVGMIERRDDLSFALESFAELRGGNFEGDVTLQACLGRDTLRPCRPG